MGSLLKYLGYQELGHDASLPFPVFLSFTNLIQCPKLSCGDGWVVVLIIINKFVS